MRRTLTALVLVASALALSGAGVAGAAPAKPLPNHASETDQAGDAPPSIDLLSGTFSLSHQRSTFSVKVKDLTETTFLAFEVWPLNSGWDRLAVFRQDGRTVGQVYNVAADDAGVQPTPVSCPGLKVTWSFRSNTVTATWPFSCMIVSQSASPGAHEFHVFSRIGGVKHSPGDTMKPVELDF
jgi:hypothetical protein